MLLKLLIMEMRNVLTQRLSCAIAAKRQCTRLMVTPWLSSSTLPAISAGARALDTALATCYVLPHAMASVRLHIRRVCQRHVLHLPLADVHHVGYHGASQRLRLARRLVHVQRAHGSLQAGGHSQSEGEPDRAAAGLLGLLGPPGSRVRFLFINVHM